MERVLIKFGMYLHGLGFVPENVHLIRCISSDAFMEFKDIRHDPERIELFGTFSVQEMGSVYEVEWGDGVQSKTVLYRPALRDEKESHAS